ncbi:MAG: phosphoenolpyruvate--protein phosphotransferase [Halanaerobiales bacterium]
MEGTGVSPGIACGPVVLKDRELEVELCKISGEEIDREITRFRDALNRVKEELQEIKERAEESLGPEKARIFSAHLRILEDPELIPAIEEAITSARWSAEAAVRQNIDRYLDIFASVEDEYIRSRGEDIRDIGSRIIQALLREECEHESNEKQMILAAEYLTPSELASYERSRIMAIVTREGSRTSHTSIVARSLGIPAVIGLSKDFFDRVSTGDRVIVDGYRGEVVLNPGESELESYRERKERDRRKEERLSSYREILAETACGERVSVLGNIGSPADLESVIDCGAEGVGLFRTEFNYMNRNTPPDEEEQYRIYRRVVEKMDGRPVTIRALDIGGDKDVKYLHTERELNPFLGYRAIRYCLDHRELFRTQLKAILRAAATGSVRIMYPLISSPEELQAANRELRRAQEELVSEGKDFSEVETGIMVETPAAVIAADILAGEADFFSIGTNDLVQYLLAVDRGNENVADVFTHFHPAVLRAVKKTVASGHRAGIEVGMCGEMAGEPLLLPFLLGIGLDEFSLSAVAILSVKETISRWTRDEAAREIEGIWELSDASKIRERLETIRR